MADRFRENVPPLGEHLPFRPRQGTSLSWSANMCWPTGSYQLARGRCECAMRAVSSSPCAYWVLATRPGPFVPAVALGRASVFRRRPRSAHWVQTSSSPLVRDSNRLVWVSDYLTRPDFLLNSVQNATSHRNDDGHFFLWLSLMSRHLLFLTSAVCRRLRHLVAEDIKC